MPQDRSVGLLGHTQLRNLLLWDHKDVDWCLRARMPRRGGWVRDVYESSGR
jgi:hypothetical protein